MTAVLSEPAPVAQSLRACPDCDALVRLPTLLAGADAYCPRCQRLLREGHTDAIRRARFISACGLFLYFPAMSLPLLEVEFFGTANNSSLAGSILSFFQSGHRLAAMVVFAMVVLAPFLNFLITGICAFISATRWPHLPWLLRVNHHIHEWSMLEVFMMGVLVSVVKLRNDVDVIIGPGLICFAGLLIMMMALVWAVDDHVFWDAIEADAADD